MQPAVLDRLEVEEDAVKDREELDVPADLDHTHRRTAAPAVSRPGRPRTGKRSNPAFEQVSVYIRKDTHREVKIALLREAGGRQFSELVEDLLTEWLKAHS